MGTGVSFPGGKAAGAYADHLPPPIAEVKNVCSYTLNHLYAFMECTDIMWSSVLLQVSNKPIFIE